MHNIRHEATPNGCFKKEVGIGKTRKEHEREYARLYRLLRYSFGRMPDGWSAESIVRKLAERFGCEATPADVAAHLKRIRAERIKERRRLYSEAMGIRISIADILAEELEKSRTGEPAKEIG